MKLFVIHSRDAFLLPQVDTKLGTTFISVVSNSYWTGVSSRSMSFVVDSEISDLISLITKNFSARERELEEKQE